MTLLDIVRQTPDFDKLAAREKIRLFCWYLHTHIRIDTITHSNVRDCFAELNSRSPDLSVYMPRMVGAELIAVRGGYKLEGKHRRSLDERYADDVANVAVTRLLLELPKKIPDLSERAFLDEAIKCYRAGAFRAAIVMAWNLAYDHLVSWIVREPTRLTAFNAAIVARFPKRTNVACAVREDFDEFKEHEVIEISYTARLISKNRTEILRERLKRRNIAAHPSQVQIEQPQADDSITDLVNNIVLALN